ncbi:MAG: hypothetical protein A3B96_00560 [Candidatus Spechtbacteria bacterium RIFCSPHIGHO2_02_FULL_43_15b]|uniref:Coenzyme F420:L-glutamate ligase-like domain-containing protein n=1 Tax=Candidatus Spechtbacteria bacterium RIFCSPHIGHO2_01_FULL_43_30 TaxID=1802158 RepID=A0A1G2H5S5_9BACT|nr:MAG: hypothetical protein A2827_00240 [Candidatus Spechtbacteria bacterium RIFCSPHIGHO2_01_FULL_43_30]OGZ58817.1 MAG: hypothetical protein A3B96_00560 [Candidatus Spechtbacteria bacterium RIFCSPHIGHO2_02_FULL_43_15b]
MIIKPIKTRQFKPPKDDIRDALLEIPLVEKSVLAVTSKIVAISEGRCVKISDIKDKDNLIKREADFYLDRQKVPDGYVMLTIKNNILIPTAGIDESNSNGYYTLWPEKPFSAAKKIYEFLSKNSGIKNFGVIISDSHTTPLRWGTMGIAMGFWGFYPLKDYRGSDDIFGRKLKITQSNIADALAASAVLLMGEGKEQTPIALIENADFLQFGNYDFEKENPLAIGHDKDIYGPFVNAMEWKMGGK